MPATGFLAIFTGGASRRMGRPKGRLLVPGSSQTIVETLVARGRSAGMQPLLVGEASVYADLVTDVERLADEPPGAGPIAGLHAALRLAVSRGTPQILAVACDMPYVSSELMASLSAHASSAPVLAARRGERGPWEPMLARYAAPQVLPVLVEAIDEGCRSFQQLFRRLEVEPLPWTPELERALHDWDRPEDLHG